MLIHVSFLIFQVTMKTSYLVILFLKILALSSGQNTRRSKSSLGNSIRRTNFNQHDLRTPSTQQREVFFVNLEDGFFGCQVSSTRLKFEYFHQPIQNKNTLYLKLYLGKQKRFGFLQVNFYHTILFWKLFRPNFSVPF